MRSAYLGSAPPVSSRAEGPGRPLQEGDAPRAAYGRVLACECQQTCFATNLEGRDAVAAPITRKEEIAARLDTALNRIITPCGAIANLLQNPIRCDRENRNRVVQPVGRVEKPSIR